MLNFRGGDVLALAAELQALGIEMETGPEVEPDGTRGTVFRDPMALRPTSTPTPRDQARVRHEPFLLLVGRPISSAN